jgi:hypothetical protein
VSQNRSLLIYRTLSQQLLMESLYNTSADYKRSQIEFTRQLNQILNIKYVGSERLWGSFPSEMP